MTTPGKEPGVQEGIVVSHNSQSGTEPTTVQSGKGGVVERIKALIGALRPRQWTKNLAVFIGIVFAQELLQPRTLLLNIPAFERAMIAFITFCLASSSI